MKTRQKSRDASGILLVCLMWMLSLSSSLHAQTWNINGNVTDEQGEPIIGANVVIQGTGTGTITDVEGNFNRSSEILNAWSPTNTGSDIPRLSKNDPNGNFTTASDWYLENASYLRLKNITLSYTFPKQWLQKAQIENARLSLSCENVATITGYSGLDPDFKGANSVWNSGTDSFAYPNTRSVMFGLDLTF